MAQEDQTVTQTVYGGSGRHTAEEHTKGEHTLTFSTKSWGANILKGSRINQHMTYFFGVWRRESKSMESSS